MNVSKKSIDWRAGGIFIIALAVRIFLFKYAFRPEIFDRFLHNYLIFHKYIWTARKIATESIAVNRILDFSPLYTFIIYLLYRFFADRYIFYILFQIVIGSLNSLLIYKITCLLFNSKTALIAGIISVFYQPFVLYELVLEPATVFIFLGLLSVYMLIYAYKKTYISPDMENTPKDPFNKSDALSYKSIRLKNRSKSRLSGFYFCATWLMPGIAIGLSFITRPNIIFFFFLALLWIFFAFFKAPRRMAAAISSVLLGFFITISPVLVRNYGISKGMLTPLMSSGQVFYQGNNPTARGFYGSHPYLLKEMESDPGINPGQEPDFAHELYRLFAKETIGAGPGHTVYEGIEPGIKADQSTGKKQPYKGFDSEPRSGIEKINTEAFWSGLAFNFIKAHPLNYIRLLGEKLRYFWSHYEIHDILQVYYLEWEMDSFPLPGFGLIIPFAILGMILCLKQIKRCLPLYAMAANFMLSNMIFFVTSRQRLPALPFLIIFAAAALYEGGRFMIPFSGQQKMTQGACLRAGFSWLFGRLRSMKTEGCFRNKPSWPFGPPRKMKTGCYFRDKPSCRFAAPRIMKIGCYFRDKGIPMILCIILISILFVLVNLPSPKIEHFTTMIQLNRDSRRSLAAGFEAMYGQEFQKSKKSFQSAYNLQPFHQTRVPNRFLGGEKIKKQGAIRFWKTVLENDQDNSYARFNLGYLFFQDESYDEALQEFSALKANNVEGFYGYMLPVSQPEYYIAACLEKKGEWEKAINEYESLIRKYPGLPWAIARLIALYEHAGDTEKAKEGRETLKRLDNNISSSYLIAGAYYHIGDYEKAANTLEGIKSETLALYSPYHFLLSACYARSVSCVDSSDPERKRSMIDASIKECRKGLELGTNQNTIHPEIAQAYEEAILLSPENGILYYELGKVYFNLGELEKARSNLLKALIIESDQISQKNRGDIEMMLEEIDFL